MAKAYVKKYHGEPAMMIDGKAYPPMTITVRTKNKQYLKDLREAGTQVFYINAMTSWNNPGGKNEDYPYSEGNPPIMENGLEYTLNGIKTLLDAVPDAYIMLRLNVAPPIEWVNSHPDDMVTFSDGSHRPVMVTTVARGVKLQGMPSLCSEAWRSEADAALDEFFDALTKEECFERVVGFFLCGGATSEWHYPQAQVQPDGAYGDFSEPFRKEFEAFLREKYGSEEQLRKAWKIPNATFEHPMIPDINARDMIENADERIMADLRGGHSMHTDADRIPTDTDAPSIGDFLNMNRYAFMADYYDAWHASTAHTIIHFAHTLKHRFPNLLVGAFYGSFGCTNYFDGGTCTGTPLIIRSGVVDFLAAPGVYNNREPGGIVAQREMQDSFRLHNMMFISEDDVRTHKIPLWVQRDAMGLYSAKDTIHVLKRDFARDLCEDIHGWWFDMGGEWYNDPDVLCLMKRQQEIAQYAYSLNRTKKNEIALIYDTESVHCVSQMTSKLVLDLYRTSDLGRIGAPVDYYFHDDLANPDMPDYRMYVMLNQYVLSDADREALFAKARKNNATVVWLYAPGYIDPNAERVMDESNIEKTTGMKVRRMSGTYSPNFFALPDAHPVMRGAQAEYRYGMIDRSVHSSVWLTPTVLPPTFINPYFVIEDDEATVLGRYCNDGSVAMAMKEMDGFTSIYCTAKVLRSELLATIAEWSGCHLFLRSDDVLYANENFVAVHASTDGHKTVYFKKQCDPYEMYEKQYYGHSVKQITVYMKKGETKMWCVNF